MDQEVTEVITDRTIRELEGFQFFWTMKEKVVEGLKKCLKIS